MRLCSWLPLWRRIWLMVSREIRSCPTAHCWRGTSTKPTSQFPKSVPPESLMDLLGFTLLILLAGRQIWLQLISRDKQRREPERQEGSLKAAVRWGSTARTWAQPHPAGITLLGRASGAGRLYFPLQLWIKTPKLPIKQTLFFFFPVLPFLYHYQHIHAAVPDE